MTAFEAVCLDGRAGERIVNALVGDTAPSERAHPIAPGIARGSVIEKLPAAVSTA